MVLAMRKRHLLTILQLIILFGTGEVFSQSIPADVKDRQIKNLLSSLRNWRYAPVSLWEIPGGTRFNQIANTVNPPDTAGVRILSGLSSDVRNNIDRAVAQGNRTVSQIISALERGGIETDDVPNLEEAIQARLNQLSQRRVSGIFVVTEREQPENIEENDVIALFVQYSSGFESAEDVINPSSGTFLTAARPGQELNQIVAGTGTPLLRIAQEAVIQGEAENRTIELQGLDNVNLAQPTYGNATIVSEDNVALIQRISEGMPLDYRNPHEVILSYDLLSYRKFDLSGPAPTSYDVYAPSPIDTTYTIDIATGDTIGREQGRIEAAATEGQIYNRSLPTYGIELRYGLEELNYPSVWSNRMIVNAMWGSNRLGVILPSSGWASLSDQLGADRKLTTAGFGINGSFNFPIKIISQSGVFDFSGSYVSKEADSMGLTQFFDERTSQTIIRDYLVRYHLQGHYSFAVGIDVNHFFRFKLGGTVYGIEGWNSVPDSTAEDPLNTNYEKTMTDTYGGISGKIEYMATNITTPWGVGLQYFDGSLMADAWLQIPISTGFAVRIDGKGFAPVFRDPHPWENKSVFLPTIRAILNF